MSDLRDNTEASQYELDVNGETAFARYRKEDGVLTILWVEAPPALRGTGAAGKLMGLVAEEATRNKWRVVPVCGYAAAWLRGSKQYRELVN
ncbi:MAG: GNAT family N-acetyltransferase [Hyphomonadaceae bacterium]|nr:GNAT family N-acetyltransferase [Hyphomonadaceae bacterium]